MRYMAVAETDKGDFRETNQDSILVQHGRVGEEEILLAAVCDGMGGLARGELASAIAVRSFSRWFKQELMPGLSPADLVRMDMQEIANRWTVMLKRLNDRISEYGRGTGAEKMGTTFSGLLLAGGRYVIAHVGASRIYELGSSMRQLTQDHTYVAREISRGRLSAEQAKRDRRRNLLLQCIGSSRIVEPQVICGQIRAGIYMLCSDGLCHELNDGEMAETLEPFALSDKGKLGERARCLISRAKERGERDNISVILVRVF